MRYRRANDSLNGEQAELLPRKDVDSREKLRVSSAPTAQRVVVIAGVEARPCLRDKKSTRTTQMVIGVGHSAEAANGGVAAQQPHYARLQLALAMPSSCTYRAYNLHRYRRLIWENCKIVEAKRQQGTRLATCFESETSSKTFGQSLAATGATTAQQDLIR